MSATESIQLVPRFQKVGQVMTLLVFAMGILPASIGMITGYRGDVVAIELRTAAAMPGIPSSIDQLESFPAAMDAFLDDQFGFRSQLLGLNSRLHVAIGVSPTPKFLIGKDGWFFHRTLDGVLDQYRGIDRFTPEELEAWVQTMERNQRWLAEHGIRMLIAIAPNKHSIYPEFLPDWVQVVNEKGRYVQILDRLAAGSPLEIVDLHTALREAKEQYRVYQKNDGHWNDLGAHVAYAAIVERIRESFPDTPLRSLDWFKIEWVKEPSGSMTLRLNMAEVVPEDLPRIRLKSASFVTRRDWPDGRPADLMEMLHFTQVIESDLPEQPVVLFIRDSFATSISRFAQESFRRTALVHHGYGGFRRELILRQQPDIVVYEITERGLSWELRIEP